MLKFQMLLLYLILGGLWKGNKNRMYGISEYKEKANTIFNLQYFDLKNTFNLFTVFKVYCIKREGKL